jgi:DNA-binding beta-propeller fold protein YncE
VWNDEDKLVSYIGKKLGIKPIDVVVRGNRLYLTDSNKNQVLVLDKSNGKLLERIGRQVIDPGDWQNDEFSMITDLALDSRGNIYVGDKVKSRLTTFHSSGEFMRMYGGLGSSADSLVRPKGITIDSEDRIWVVDAGPACAVKVFNHDGLLLMYLGTLGTEPGQLYLPADVIIDYDHVDLFKDHAVEGAELEFVILVTSQFGSHKVSVYGFGNFPQKYTLSSDSDEKEIELEKLNLGEETGVVEK